MVTASGVHRRLVMLALVGATLFAPRRRTLRLPMTPAQLSHPKVDPPARFPIQI